MILKIPLIHFALVRFSSLSTSALMSSVVASILIAVVTAAGPLAVIILSPPSPGNTAVPLIGGGALACLGWLVGIVMTQHPIRGHALDTLKALRERSSPR